MDFIKLLSLLGLTFIFTYCSNLPHITCEEEYFYNEEGQLTAILKKVMDKDTFWTKDSFIYDSLKREIAIERTDSRFKSKEITTYKYDSDGDTIEMKITGGNNSFDKLFLHTYADKEKNQVGCKVRIETKQYHISDTKDTTLYSSIQYKGGSAWMHWTERITFIYSPDSVSVVNEKYKSEYNEYDTISESISCRYKDGELVEQDTLRSKILRKGTEDSQVIYHEIYEHISYTPDEGTIVYYYKYRYWQDRGSEKCKERVATAVKDGVEISKAWWKYDQYERKKKDIYIEIKGDTTIKTTLTYKYDDADRLVKITTRKFTELNK